MRELTGRSSLWVRAVDGVDFDVNPGEVFCLVGESGCGKTTTGKTLLRLVNATAGDALLEMPDAEYRRYEELRKAPPSEKSENELAQLRRRFSLTWEEKTPWSSTQFLLLAGFIAAGAILAMVAPVLLVSLFGTPFASDAFLFGLCLVEGLVIGIVSSLPPARVSSRTPAVVALIALLAPSLTTMLAAIFFASTVPGASDGYLAGLSTVWGNSTFTLIVATLFGAAAAGGSARIVLSIRRESEGLTGLKMRALRRRLHLIFQDPYESLNPKQSVFEIVSEPLIVNKVSRDPQEIAALVAHSLDDAGLRPAEEFMFRFPHELSGGQRQRVSIAAALALEPDFIVADEPVSMLDVSIRTEILDLMMELRRRRGITYLFITHDLGLAWILADRIAVMYLGRIVEQGTAEQVIAHPKHPYTQALISVVPSPDPRHVAQRTILKGERPDPVNIPTGCRFHPRCPLAFERCGWNADEVADEIKAAQDEILARLGATIADKEGRAVDLRSRAKADPAAATTLEAEAAALEKEAQELRSSHQRARAVRDAVKVQDPHHVVLAPSGATATEVLEQAIRGLIQAQRATRLAFRGVTEVATGPSGVVLTLHDWSEPELVEVEPGNTVACHLITAPGVPAVAPSVVPA